MQPTREKIVEKLQSLPEPALQEVLDFVDFLVLRMKKPTGIPGKELLHFAGAIEADDLTLIAKAIEADCGKVNLHEW